MRVLVVPDKFKGTLDVQRVAEAIARGWRRVRPKDRLDLCPMSDGGDGFGSVIGGLLKARMRSTSTVDAAGRPRRARWWWASRQKTAVVETAESNGLALLPKGQFHPFDLDTFGVGELIADAVEAGARTCLLGVGGSATNDGGFGMARALGWRFLDAGGKEIQWWTNLHRLARIESPEAELPRAKFIVATDVGNPLLGPRGATRVYGPQKGLRPHQLMVAEKSLRQLAKVVKAQFDFDSRAPGSGAAGGLGFGLQVFLQAERRLGFEVFAEFADLERRIQRTDLVITAEGALDASTLMGKGVGQVLQLAAKHRKPAVVLAGKIDVKKAPPGVIAMQSLIENADVTMAMSQPARVLATVAAKVAREIAGKPIASKA